jgi:dihydrodipicolinate synthase/N-acetylneuraminate lyase
MIKGSLVPNITIFDSDGNLDQEKTRWHMDWMLKKGTDGFFLTGSYGSGPLMTTEERITVFKIAKEVVKEYSGKFLIPHVGSIDNKTAVELAKAAEAVGVDGIAAVPPYYYKYSEELVVQYFKDILNAVKIPVYAYNNPETSRFNFSLETVRKLQAAGLAGLKDSPVDVGFMSTVFYDAKLHDKKFEVIPGTSKGWLLFYYMGVRAMIAGMNNYAPEIITELVRATFDGKVNLAEKIYMVMMDLSAKLHFADSTIASHMALYARGFNAGFPRRPMALPAFDSPKYKEIRVFLQKGFQDLGLEMELGDDNTVK